MMENMENNYLNICVLSLTLIFLGIFITFFVRLIPLPIGVIVCLIGVILGIKYFYHVIKLCFKLRKEQKLSIFAKTYFPALLCIIIFLLMIGSFLSASVIHEGTIYIDPDSRKLIIYSVTSDQAVSVKGPYVVDSAIENESNIIRMPHDAMSTLGISINDTIKIGDSSCTVQKSRMTESDVLRIPINVKAVLNLTDGDIIQNIYLGNKFAGSQVVHNNTINSTFAVIENFFISDGSNASYYVDIIMDNQTIYHSSYILGVDNYKISFNGGDVKTISFNGNEYSSNFDYNGHQVTVKIMPSRDFSMRNLVNSSSRVAIDLYI